MTEPGSQPTSPAVPEATVPGGAGEDPQQPEVAAAVQATSAAYTDDAQVDVVAMLRDELEKRGQAVDDESLERLRQLVRAGHVDEVFPQEK